MIRCAKVHHDGGNWPADLDVLVGDGKRTPIGMLTIRVQEEGHEADFVNIAAPHAEALIKLLEAALVETMARRAGK